MRLALSAAQPGDTAVTLASSSPQGQLSASAGGPWSSTLPLTIAAGQTTSPDFYYLDTKAGSPTLTATAPGVTGASQTEHVAAAALSAISVSPSSASLSVGGTQVFTASGSDAYGNPVSVSGAAWSTTVPGGSVSPGTGSSTTFTAGATPASGNVTASVGVVSKSAAVTVTGITPPSNLTATAPSARRRINLAWTGSGSGATYRVYRGTSPGGESTTPIATGITATTWTDRGVTSGTTYYYRVTAVRSGAESAPSNEAHATAR
jgi:cellulose 1,4-beta-cellobiosidase